METQNYPHGSETISCVLHSCLPRYVGQPALALIARLQKGLTWSQRKGLSHPADPWTHTAKACFLPCFRKQSVCIFKPQFQILQGKGRILPGMLHKWNNPGWEGKQNIEALHRKNSLCWRFIQQLLKTQYSPSIIHSLTSSMLIGLAQRLTG